MRKKNNDNNLASIGVPLEITVTNPKTKSKHKCPCLMPMDCIGMDSATFTKSYGPHIVNAVHDLLQHKSFTKGLDSKESSLILSP
jgi:hypothetical protein